MTGADVRLHVLWRARSLLVAAYAPFAPVIGYQLGNGGRRPLARHPGKAWRPTKTVRERAGLWCDCSGFVSWCCGLDRYQPRDSLLSRYNGGWISTDAIVYDAQRPRSRGGWFVQVPPHMVEPGDLVVYGDDEDDEGHVAVVSEFAANPLAPVGAPALLGASLRIIDCAASGGATRPGVRAIRERDGSFFLRHAGTLFARLEPPDTDEPAPV